MNAYTRMLICLAAIAVLAAPSCAAPTPFVIGGWIFYENDTACDYPAVNITNLDTGVEWHAEKNASSNYYQIVRTNGTDLNETEQLRFSTKSSDGSQSNVTKRIVAHAEVDAGGIFGFNITLGSSEPMCLGTCYNGTVCGGTIIAENMPCWECLVEWDRSWQPTTNCPDRELRCPDDICFAYEDRCPACANGLDDDDDGLVDCDDLECACCCDSTEDSSDPTPCVPELATFALIGVGLMLVVGLMRFGRNER